MTVTAEKSVSVSTDPKDKKAEAKAPAKPAPPTPEEIAKAKAVLAAMQPPVPPANVHPVNPQIVSISSNDDGSVDVLLSMTLNETIAKTFVGAAVVGEAKVDPGGYTMVKFNVKPSKSVDDVIAEDQRVKEKAEKEGKTVEQVVAEEAAAKGDAQSPQGELPLGESKSASTASDEKDDGKAKRGR